MQASELYRQRAMECDRMAQEHPAEGEKLKEIAKTWRSLAQAADELSEVAGTLH